MGRFKSDMFPKRESKKMTNLVSGLFTGMLFAPLLVFDGVSNINTSQDISDKPISKIIATIFIIIGIVLIPLFIPLILFGLKLFDFPFIGPFLCFPILIIPFGIWGGIITIAYEAFTYRNDKDKKQKQKLKMSIYGKLINTINEDKSLMLSNKIREDYYDIVNSNNNIRQQITILNNKVDKCERRIKSFRYFPILKNKYISKKEKILLEIKIKEELYKKPIISLDVFSNNESTIQDINGEVFFKLNFDFIPKQTINFDSIAHSEIKKCFFFDVNINPKLSLQFNSLELHFYDDVLIIMSKKDFAIVSIESLSVSYKTMFVHSKSSKYYKAFNKKPVGLIYYDEIALVEINVLSQKLNLLFSNIVDGLIIYSLLIKSQNYEE